MRNILAIALTMFMVACENNTISMTKHAIIVSNERVVAEAKATFNLTPKEEWMVLCGECNAPADKDRCTHVRCLVEPRKHPTKSELGYEYKISAGEVSETFSVHPSK